MWGGVVFFFKRSAASWSVPSSRFFFSFFFFFFSFFFIFGVVSRCGGVQTKWPVFAGGAGGRHNRIGVFWD